MNRVFRTPRAGNESMSGTKHSTGGFRRITRLGQPVKVRFLGFILVVVIGSLAVGWVTRTTWNQLERLQKDHAAVKSESFYLGVTLRSSVRSLNGKLLQYALSKDPQAREGFATEAEELLRLMRANQAELGELAGLRLVRRIGLDSDLELLGKVRRSFEKYLEQTAVIFDHGGAPEDPRGFEATFQRVQSASAELLILCNQLLELQRQGFTEFLASTQSTLADHQRLLRGSSILILLLAGTLAWLVYRGMIAPLRKGLAQSSRVIERQEKLASLGVLASGVAHEIRNPLTAIKFRLFSLRKTTPALAEDEDVTTIAEEINRLERIVKDVLRFARPSDPALAPVPAQKLLADAHDFLKGQFQRSGIQLTLSAAGGVWVLADEQQMKQVLINLIQNAADAIGRNGVIALHLRAGEAQLGRRVKSVAILSVADSGNGIPPEVEARLFDPFFTTKEGGTGLGLAIAARIVELHGGILRYETESNRGTTFEVALPIVEHETSATITD